MLNKTEILAPAGNSDAVRAAVNAGADAVYLGGSLFSARAFAGNFNEEELLSTIDFCHIYDVKVYMAINTLLKNEEIKRLPEYVEPYYRYGVDGIIVQDVGVVSVLSECFPDLPLHGSTQMSVSSLQGASFLKKIGMTRFVPSRELTLDEIKTIKNSVNMEIETFVHGAMCYCYSGRCLMSSFAGGRSGNRGRCAQPCRKKYQIGNNNEYVLSLKDMCMLKFLDKLVDSGIDSFKIEGRMKKPEYVAAAVHAYREVRDQYLGGGDIRGVAEKQEKILLDVYNRGGFCSGYYYTQNGREMLSNTRPNHTGIFVGKVGRIDQPWVEINLKENVYKGDILEIRGRKGIVELTCNIKEYADRKIRLKAKSFKSFSTGDMVYRTRNEQLLAGIRTDIIENERKIPVDMELEARAGQPLSLRVKSCGPEAESLTYGTECMKADKRPVSKDQFIEKISKTGGTPYSIRELKVAADDDVFVQMGALNSLRRDALNEYTRKLLERYKRAERTAGNSAWEHISHNLCEVLPGITVGVSSEEHVNIVKKYKCISNVIVDYNGRKYCQELREAGCRVFLALPEIFRQKYSSMEREILSVLNEFDGVLIRNIDELGLISEHGYDGIAILDASMYAYNDMAFEFYRRHLGHVCFMASHELTLEEIHGLSVDMILKVYGHQKVMITANCLQKNYLGGCRYGAGSVAEMTDDMGNKFYVKNKCDNCYNIIYNGVPTSILDKLPDICDRSDSVYIEFTVENGDSVKKVMDIVQAAASGDVESANVSEFTRGHYYKGID